MRYARPGSLAEALAALRDGGTALSGGTDLLVRAGREEPWPEVLVDLKALPELRTASESVRGLRLGAGLPLADLLDAPALAAYPALRSALARFAGRQIRERATLGGNLANASPAADTLPPLICCDARCVTDRRVFPVGELMTGPGATILAPDEILLALELPKPAPEARSFFHKLAGREAMAIAWVNVAVCLVLKAGRVLEPRIALGAVAPTVIRALAAEDLLRGESLSPTRISAAAAAAAAACAPIDDIRASADYRRAMVERILAYELGRLG